MIELDKGRYRARFARTRADIEAAQRLRHRCFRGAEGLDRDQFDDACLHVLVERTVDAQAVGCFRLLPILAVSDLGACYSAQHYDLSSLRSFPGRMVELGRFCIAPGLPDTDILRLAWGVLTRYVDANRVDLLFGCSSFAGTDPGARSESFACLAEHHLAPDCWRPGKKAAETILLADSRAMAEPDTRRAVKNLPPLLRSYLAMGGWVGDHAVIDRDLNTMHVFTGLEIAKIPASRARLLRAIAE